MKDSPTPRHVLVTGHIRSGTTYVGHVLARNPGLHYLDEPFSLARGIEGVTHWFPYAEARTDPYGSLVDRFMGSGVRYRRATGGGPLASVVKRVVGGRPQWRDWWYRASGPGAAMLIKDPLAVLLSGYLARNHRVGVVLLVRHPAAFFHSNHRLGWTFDFSNLLDQPELMDRHLSDERELMLRGGLTEEERSGLLWRCIYKVVGSCASSPETAPRIVIRHEDLSRDPMGEFSRIHRALGLDYGEATRKFIERTTASGNPVSAPGNRTHALHRDSARLAEYWRSEMTEEQVRSIRRVVGEVADQYYTEREW